MSTPAACASHKSSGVSAEAAGVDAAFWLAFSSFSCRKEAARGSSLRAPAASVSSPARRGEADGGSGSGSGSGSGGGITEAEGAERSASRSGSKGDTISLQLTPVQLTRAAAPREASKVSSGGAASGKSAARRHGVSPGRERGGGGMHGWNGCVHALSAPISFISLAAGPAEQWRMQSTGASSGLPNLFANAAVFSVGRACGACVSDHEMTNVRAGGMRGYGRGRAGEKEAQERRAVLPRLRSVRGRSKDGCRMVP